MRKERGYLDALRQVMAGGEGGFSGHVRLAASIQFKAVIKKYWVGVGEEGENPVGDEEREGIKVFFFFIFFSFFFFFFSLFLSKIIWF